MSASSDRLAQSRLAIIEHIRQKQERGGPLRSAFRSAMAAAGLRREPAPQQSASTAPAEEARAERRAEPRPEAPVHAAQAAPATEPRPPGQPPGAQEPPPPLPDGSNPAAQHEHRARELFGGRFKALGEAGLDYWHHHPARLVVELATPALASYAQKHPMRYLALSAGAGALIYLARPWRLISLTGLAVAALRSPQLSGALVAALYGPRQSGGPGEPGAYE
mgnify:FL=1